MRPLLPVYDVQTAQSAEHSPFELHGWVSALRRVLFLFIFLVVSPWTSFGWPLRYCFATEVMAACAGVQVGVNNADAELFA